MKRRGLKQVEISTVILTELMKEGMTSKIKCIKGLPPDAEFAYWYISPFGGRDKYQTLMLVFISEEFEELENGQLIPTMKVEFNKIL